MSLPFLIITLQESIHTFLRNYKRNYDLIDLCEQRQITIIYLYQLQITLQAVRRGDLHVYLTSPAGTKSTLLTMRPRDDSRLGFNQWPFMTVHNWGENPNGNWTLEIHNEGAFLGKDYFHEFLPMSLVFLVVFIVSQSYTLQYGLSTEGPSYRVLIAILYGN